MKKKLLTSTMVLAAAALVTSTVVSAYTKDDVRQEALKDTKVQAYAMLDQNNPGYKAMYEQALKDAEASVEASFQKEGKLPEPSSSSSSSSSSQGNPWDGSVYYGTVIGQYAENDPRFTSLGLDPSTKAYYEKLDEIAAIIEKEMNGQPGAGNGLSDGKGDVKITESKYLGTYVGELTLNDARFTSQNLDPNSQKYHDEHERISAIIEKELNGQPGAGSGLSDGKGDVQLKKSKYLGTHVGELALHDVRFTSQNLDPNSQKYHDEHERISAIIEKELNSQKGAGSTSIDRGSNEYKDGNKRPAYGEEPKSGSVSKASSSKSSSTKASSSAASSSSKAASSDKGSKESKSTDVAVNDAKKAAKQNKEGQKVLPNTAAVK